MKLENSLLSRIVWSLTLLAAWSVFNPLLAQEEQEWVARSDAYTAKILEIYARQNPESAARIGVDGYDEEITDLSSGFRERAAKDLEEARVYLLSEYGKETDRTVKQDLQILLTRVTDGMERTELENALLLPYHSVAGSFYEGIQSLLEDRIPATKGGRPGSFKEVRRDGKGMSSLYRACHGGYGTGMGLCTRPPSPI